MASALLGPLLALAGQCYAGQVSPGSVDRHCFSSMLHGHHVRDVHIVATAGRPVYSGETIYSVEGQSVTFIYVSSIGGVGHGSAHLEPRSWAFSGTMRATAGAEPTPFAVRWSWSGGEAYSVSGGPATVTYRRTSARRCRPIRRACSPVPTIRRANSAGSGATSSNDD